MKSAARLLTWIEQLVCTSEEAEESRRRKIQFTAFSIFVIPAAVIWAIMYFVSGERRPALIPSSYAVLTLLDLLFLIRYRQYEMYRRIQQILILLLPFFLHLSLGGFIGSSSVIIWSFLAVVGGVLFGSGREAIGWFIAYSLDLALAALFQPHLTIDNHLSSSLILSLYVLNIATVSGIAFAVLYSFLQDRRRLRELELAYLNQEMMLRQSEKLATLGTLAAGLAHELNNPAAATKRAALQMKELLIHLNTAQTALSHHQLSVKERESIDDILSQLENRTSGGFSSLERSDKESELEEWLEEIEVDNSWSVAPILVSAGFDVSSLRSMTEHLHPDILIAVINLLAAKAPIHALVEEIAEGSSRISTIVTGVKGYSFLDQAPVQKININDGIENTLLVLKNTIGEGIRIHRNYGEIPPVMAYGSDLNQVWTNILVNAVDAMHGTGNLRIVTRREDQMAVVEIEDDGPGIPKEILPKVFDPFFTTKPPGAGPGLGLATSFGIITQKHKGAITARSQPASTVFTVRLPLSQDNL